jgi:hypothetical protein
MDEREKYLELTNNIEEAKEIITDGSDAEMTVPRSLADNMIRPGTIRAVAADLDLKVDAGM